jgi:hypothetical protein
MERCPTAALLLSEDGSLDWWISMERGPGNAWYQIWRRSSIGSLGKNVNSLNIFMSIVSKGAMTLPMSGREVSAETREFVSRAGKLAVSRSSLRGKTSVGEADGLPASFSWLRTIVPAGVGREEDDIERQRVLEFGGDLILYNTRKLQRWSYVKTYDGWAAGMLRIVAISTTRRCVRLRGDEITLEDGEKIDWGLGQILLLGDKWSWKSDSGASEPRSRLLPMRDKLHEFYLRRYLRLNKAYLQ